MKGEDRLDMEIQIALSEKKPDFEVLRDLPSVKQLVDAHIANSPVKGPTVQIKQEALAADQFALVMRQLKYDEGAFEAWAHKCQTARSAAYYKKQEFKLGVHNDCMEAADDFDMMKTMLVTMVFQMIAMMLLKMMMSMAMTQ